MVETTRLLATIGSLSYEGIFGISLLSNVIIPIPEEAILLMLGYASRENGASFFLVVTIVMSGLLMSDLIMYGLSRKGNRFILMFYKKFFSKRLDDRRAWFEKNIESVIFFSRFLLQLRFLGPFLAGQSRVSLRKFLTFELAALVIYVPLVIEAGWYFHRHIQNIMDGINILRNTMLIAIALIVLIYVYRSISQKMYKKSVSEEL
jgi:membrane protein DedA with SNARE-associated domain